MRKVGALGLVYVSAPRVLAFVPVQVSTTTTQSSSTTSLFGDGNPPPFESWYAPSPPAPAPVPVTTPPPSPSYSDSVVPASAPAPAVAPVAVGGGSGPIAKLYASQVASVHAIAEAIPDLAMKPDLAWANGETLVGGVPCTLDARDAPGPANVAWLSSVHIPNRLASLTIFNGPLTDVPHLLSRVYMDSDTQEMQLALDFRPRAYGAYEMVDANGNYPGPEQLGRKAFEYSGARMDFFNKFGTKAFQDKLFGLVKSLEEASTLPRSEMDLLTGGPLGISLVMPASDHNVQIVTQLRDMAAKAWLTWATDKSGKNSHRPGAPINTQYVYDSKFRLNSFLALKDYYSPIFGPGDASTLAVGESGPLDEAYVGGGS